MFDHLQTPRESTGFEFDSSAALEQRVLDLLGDTSDNPQGERIRQLVHERFEALRAAPATSSAGAVAAPPGRPYAEPGSPADQINRLQSVSEHTEARIRAAEEAISCLAGEITRLRRHTEDLQAASSSTRGRTE